MVMDYAEGGDLASVIKIMQARDERLPEDWSRAVAKQVASALAYMHSEGVIHCDLKPGNTMLLRKFSLGEASEIFPHVLLDFGLAEIFDGEEAAGGKPAVKGTPAYLAPEGFEGRLTCKSDVWALGVMVFEMLTNERPFRGSTNVFMLFCQVANTHPPLDRLPQLAQDFVREVMQKDPDDRPQASQLLIFQWFLDQQRRLTAGLSKTFDLETLGHASYFQRAVMFCMAVGLGANNAPGQDMDGIFHAFKLMDEDESGTLTVDELKKGLKLLGIQQNAEALMPILETRHEPGPLRLLHGVPGRRSAAGGRGLRAPPALRLQPHPGPRRADIHVGAPPAAARQEGARL
ncbi:unnamed protein product [Prorocentrum cordatum]|uniref:Non-specific serine/threonine protein kinase n=1 Tax=Prorocentrum cordatum TaxID=2364126 RepID=A0ABN9PMD3_9DINO|nr:unnamed protein product [Polarella glacialis]